MAHGRPLIDRSRRGGPLQPARLTTRTERSGLLYSLNDAVNVRWDTSCLGAMAEQQDRSSPHPCGIYGAARVGGCGTARRWAPIHGKDGVAGRGGRRPMKKFAFVTPPNFAPDVRS